MRALLQSYNMAFVYAGRMAYSWEVLVTQEPTYEELEQRIQKLEAEAVERKAIEQALRESEEKYRMVVERANDGIAIIQDGLLKYVNPRMAEITGYTVEEGIDTPFTNYVDPDEVLKAEEDYKRRIAGEQLPMRYERGLRHKNQSGIDTEISGGLITYRGKPADLVLVRDITERKQNERLILRSKAMLQSIFDGITDPLIMLDRARGIVRRFLGFARQKDVKTEAVDLNGLLRDVLGFLEKEAFHRNIDIQLDFSQDIPTLESDKGRLQQAFLNIIKNAFEAVDDKGHISITTCLKDPRTVRVKIADDGRGMSPEQVEQTFKPFHTSGKESGTGVGLYITHQIVTNELGGQITVHSEEGKGTTFTVELPLKWRMAKN